MPPERFPATGTDIGVSITRMVTHHRIGLHVVLPGRLDADRLARAVRLTLDAEPILGTRFVTGGLRTYWERLEDLDDRVPFAVRETDDPGDAAVAFQVVEVTDDGPQVAVTLIRGAEADELGIKVSHVVADGQAAKQYAYLLADTYTRLAGDPGYAPQPNARPRPSASDVWNALTADQQRAAKKAAPFTMPNWPIAARATSDESPTYRCATLAPSRFAAVKSYGQERGASVNDVMLTAFFRACVRAFDPPTGVPLSMMSTADHRRFLPDPASLPISNVSISGSLAIPRIDGESFADTLRRVHASMAEWAATSYGVGPARNAERLTRLGYATARLIMGLSFRLGKPGMTYPWYTNIGIIDAGRLVFDGVRPSHAFMFGPFVSGASVVPCLSTYADTLTISMGYCARDFDVEPVLALFDEEIPRPAP